MRPLSTLPKVQRKNYDVSGMGRYIQNILQWEENYIKSKKMTNGDYFLLPPITDPFTFDILAVAVLLSLTGG